jgi:predicted lactoylglutathione lyase
MLIPRDGFGWVVGEAEVARRGTVEVLLSLEAPDDAGVRAVTDAAVAAGGQVAVAPGQQPWGYVAVVADPDGHLWQVIADPQDG